MVIPPKYKPTVTMCAGIATLLLFCWNGVKQKDKNVTGGVVQQTASGAIADAGTRSLVDETIKATIKSGEQVTPEQKQAALS